MKLTPWENDKLMKLQVDEMASWCNGKLMKWQVDEMTSWWNGKVDEIASLWHGKLMKWQVDEISSWWNIKLIQQKENKMPTKWNGKLTKEWIDKMARKKELQESGSNGKLMKTSRLKNCYSIQLQVNKMTIRKMALSWNGKLTKW